MLFISYGGDGEGNGNGSVLAYDLLAERVVWTVHLNTGVDSGGVSPDGKRLYMPTGENASSGIWNILDTSNGAVIATIQGGSAAHNTVVSKDGRYVYLGGRDHNYLEVYDTTTGHVRGIGPLVNGDRTRRFPGLEHHDGKGALHGLLREGALRIPVLGAQPRGLAVT
jgi:DNA-binding beta-propeller fold protein YncE